MSKSSIERQFGRTLTTLDIIKSTEEELPMHPFPFFQMIGTGYVFIALLLIVALIVCIAITVTTSRISNKKMKAEEEKEMMASVIVTDNSTDQG